MTASLYGPECGTFNGSSGLRPPPGSATGAFFSSTRLWSALRRACSSRPAVSVIARLASLLTQVVPPSSARARATQGTSVSASNSPVSIRAVNSRTTDVSTSPML
jgi:hypothetical protein